jgi:hypothetical protein
LPLPLQALADAFEHALDGSLGPAHGLADLGDVKAFEPQRENMRRSSSSRSRDACDRRSNSAGAGA